MNIKPDDKLAYIVSGETKQNIGRMVEVVAFAPRGIFECDGFWYAASIAPSWIVRAVGLPLASVSAISGRIDWVTQRPYTDDCLRPIRDQPGNESFVAEARKSLPRPAAAKGDTIDARGEVHS